MQELEKILEEIESKKFTNMTIKHSMVVKMEDVRDIIRKHMNDGWISVKDRLPDESLNSVIGWDEYRERCCFVQYYGGKWSLRADREPIKIIAWRPLPEPYRPERSMN